MRALHHALPLVETRLTRSPSRTALFRNSATAPLARWAWGGARWMSSKTIMNVRAVCTSGAVLVEITGRGRGVAEGAAGSWTASKLAIAWGSPSSESAKSAAVRSGIGAPFLSVTTRSTVTSSIWEGKVGVAAAGEGEGAGAGGMAWAPARQGTTRKAERLSTGFQFI